MSGGITALYCNDDFTKLASLAIKKAFDYAGASGHTYIGSEHLLYGISTEGTAGVILRSSGVTDERIKKEPLLGFFLITFKKFVLSGLRSLRMTSFQGYVSYHLLAFFLVSEL